MLSPKAWKAMDLAANRGRASQCRESEMGSEAQGQRGPLAPREAELQCTTRDENEAVERMNDTLQPGAARAALRCECGDPACDALLTLTHTEYEAVRDYGSHFLITLNHENPENTAVLFENARFAVVDVVAGAERYQVLARNPRHAWVETTDGKPE
jgi:hypothetical protein